MMFKTFPALFVAFSTVTASFAPTFATAFANEPLDRPYNLTGKHPAPSTRSSALTVPRSPTARIVSYQTPVKSQASRGTCSIFSATALVESMIALRKGVPAAQLDYSEEWLEYLNTRTSSTDGGSSDTNFATIVRYGMADEASLPYVGETWDTVTYSSLSKERCGAVPANLVKSCLLAHRDPRLLQATDAQLGAGVLRDEEFLKARREATAMKAKYLTSVATSYYLLSEDDVKAQLAKGIPLTLDLDFFYGAWNHRKADTVCEAGTCIGRDLDNWDRGIIGYPEQASLDRKLSKQGTNRAGHSVVVVGYDDTVVVTTKQKVLEAGKYVEKTFTYKGVYYIKNSWGTEGFGRLFKLGNQALPGYGMITQKYAHEQGAFFQLPIR